MQQAGQQMAQGQGQGKSQDDASDEAMGQGFSSGQSGGQSGSQSAGQNGQGQSGQGQSGGNGGKSGQGGQPASGSGAGMGGPGRGAGGRAGPQQPLAGVKKDTYVPGMVDPRGKKLSRSFMGTPDPTQDRAAYYQVVPERIRAAEASLNREEIPTSYRKQVRDYFEAIQPR